MKRWKKILISYLVICSVAVKLWSINVVEVSAEENWVPDTELLIALDNSGSMKKTGKEMEEVIELIGKLLEARDVKIPVTYLLFNENVHYVEDERKINLETGKETCIWQGIEHADSWIKDRIADGKNVKLLFISDLFSSRKLEKSGITFYTFETASEEQENINMVVDQWKQWEAEKKLDVVVWTWKSLCTGEDSQNTITYLEKNNKEAAENGYQVTLKINNGNIFKLDFEKDKATFIKHAVKSFEMLLYGMNEDWRSWNISKSGEKKYKTDNDTIGYYIYFPDTVDIEVKDGKPVCKNLYLVEGEMEYLQVVVSVNNGEKCKGYILRIPDLDWEMNIDTRIEKGKEFSLQMKTDTPISGAWGRPEDYECKVKIYKKNEMQKKEYKEIVLTYEPDKEVFEGKCILEEAENYCFIGYINGKRLRKDISKKVN